MIDFLTKTGRDYSEPERSLAMKEAEATVAENAIFQLPEELRAIYILYNYSDLSIADIAVMMEMEEELIELRLEEARARLSARMDRLAIAFLMLDYGKTSIADRVMAQITPMENIAAVSTTTAAGTQITFSGILTAVALPFLWVFTLLIGGQRCGTEFVRNAPTLQARRWLTKQLFTLYYMVSAVPALLFFIGHAVLLRHVGWSGVHSIVGVLTTCFIAIAILVVGRMRSKYKRIRINPEYQEIEYPALRRFIHWGYLGTSMLFLAFLAAWIFEILLPGLGYSLHTRNDAVYNSLIISTAAFGLMIVASQASTISLFNYFLRISKDDATLKSTPLPLDAVKGDWKIDMLREFVYVLPFAFFFISIHFVHLLTVRTRIVAPVAEIAVYSFLWWVVVRYNIKHPEQRWRRIILMVVIQLVITTILRQSPLY